MELKENTKQDILIPTTKNIEQQSKSFEKDPDKEIKAAKIISNEIKKIFNFIQERENISNRIKKFITISEKYSLDIACLTLDLKQDESSFEGKINTIFYDIMTSISNSINEMLKNISEQIKYKTNNSEKRGNDSTDFEVEIQQLKSSLISNMKTTKKHKKLYFDECFNFEEYLVKKELLSMNKAKNDFRKKDDFNFEIVDMLVDNHTELYDKQHTYQRSKKKCNEIIQKILCLIIREKTDIYKDIYNYLTNFVNQIHKLNQIQNNNCLNFEKSLSLPLLELNYDNEQKTFSSLLDTDYYCFKCLENYNISFDKTKNIISNQNTFIRLNEDQLLKIFEEVKKNKIMISDSDEKKLNIVRKRYNIISIIKLIISDTKKFDKKLKDEFISLLKTDNDNLKTFILFLNNKRANSQKILSKKVFNELAELFTIIIEYLTEKQDYLTLQQIFLMSSTYFFEENGKKKFLFKGITKLKIFKESTFWENFLRISVIEELNLYRQKNETKINEQNEINSAIFSSILTVIQIMSDYDIDIKFIINFLEKHAYVKYSLPEDKKKEILMFLESKNISNENNITNYYDNNKENIQKSENNEDDEKKIKIGNEIGRKVNKEGEENNDVINSNN